MSSDTCTDDTEQCNSLNRKSVYQWDNPGRDFQQYRWYNPLLWVFLTIDILVVIRWYYWHKLQSRKARRTTINHHVVFGLQSCDFVLKDADVSETRKDNVRDARRHLEKIAEELNIESEHLDWYVETDSEQERDE